MKHKIKILSMIICVSLFLSSCSTLSEFMIVNETGSEIEVEYTVKNIQNYEKPRITDSAKVLGNLKDWKGISADALKIDESAKKITVKLADQKALIVAAEVNYLGHDKEDFSIEKISIRSGGKSLESSGKEAQELFKKQENGDYVLIYK